jgi:hypothetical protein
LAAKEVSGKLRWAVNALPSTAALDVFKNSRREGVEGDRDGSFIIASCGVVWGTNCADKFQPALAKVNEKLGGTWGSVQKHAPILLEAIGLAGKARTSMGLERLGG